MKRLVISGGLAALLAIGVTVIAVAQFIDAHVASGDVSTATSTSDLLYICQPSGTTVSPQCPVDTAGGDETVFVGSEDLLPGAVKWQKIRLTNTGATYAWDVLSMSLTWTEIADPGGICNTVPEGVRWRGSTTSEPIGVTILGRPTGGFADPFNIGYDYLNDNHLSVANSQTFALPEGSYFTIHVGPGGYEDLLLGIRLPITTPASCMNVIWQLSTTWNIQIHVP